MKAVKHIDENWKITGTSPDKKTIEFTGAVPGYVNQQLVIDGVLPEPVYMYNANDHLWVEDWQWTYTCKYIVDYDLNSEFQELVFEGVDTFADIYLNDHHLGYVDNMFMPHRFKVKNILKKGPNEITIKFKLLKDAIEHLPHEEYQSTFSNDRAFARKMQCVHKWDWVRRFIAYGLHLPIKVELWDQAKIENYYFTTKDLDNYSAAIYTEVEIQKHIDFVECEIQLDDPSGNPVFYQKRFVHGDSFYMEFSVADPELWWPSGAGKQPLYTINLRLLKGERIIDELSDKVGIRTIVVEQLQDRLGSEEHEITLALRKDGPFSEFDNNGKELGSSFTIKVNGRRIFCQGGNFVPLEPYPANLSPERYDRLTDQVVEGNMNMVRVWGGATYAPLELLRNCDRKGILILHDFIMACAVYPYEVKGFSDNFAKDTEWGIKYLRNHPSLALYAGDNELGMFENFDDKNYNGREVFEKITMPLLKRFDPNRHIIPTSPYGGRINNSLTMGNCHYTCGIDLDMDYARDRDMTDFSKRENGKLSRFVTEAVSFGAPSFGTVDMMMPVEERANRELWTFHTGHHPNRPTYSLYDWQDLSARKIFAETDQVDRHIVNMQYLQYEQVRILMENHRRNMWYSSGLVFWMLNDIWAESLWSMIDYFSYPKGGYFAMKSRGKNVISSIERKDGRVNIFVVNSMAEDAVGGFELKAIDPVDGSILESFSKKSFSVPSDRSEIVTSYSAEAVIRNDCVLVCNIEGNFDEDRSVLYDDRHYGLDLKRSELLIERIGDVESGKIRISADTFAKGVRCDGDFDFDLGFVDLLPGETVDIEYRKPAFGAAVRRCRNDILVYGQNSEIVKV